MGAHPSNGLAPIGILNEVGQALLLNLLLRLEQLVSSSKIISMGNTEIDKKLGGGGGYSCRLVGLG